MLLEYGMSVQPPDWHVAENKAPMYARVYYVLGGDTRYRSGEFTQKLQKNWLYIFPVHAPYEMTTDPENPLECLYLHLDLHTVHLKHWVAIPVEKDRELTNLLQVLRDGIAGNYPGEYLELLAAAFEKLCLHKGLLTILAPEANRLEAAIRSTYRQDRSLQSIAGELGYSTEYFIRLFKGYMGVSPHQYAISLRMSDGVRMLTGSASLEQIAEAIGYRDAHSFSNAFRRYYGISPIQYRQHCTGYA